jgi:UDP-N-acetylglucosamine:LPS N-acetylglucosamine transferase
MRADPTAVADSRSTRGNPGAPVVASVEMGYGHLRPAHALAAELGVEVVRADRPPLAHADEVRLWTASRRFYEATSRLSQLPVVGPVLQPVLEAVTAIPHLHPRRDLSRATLAVRMQNRSIRRGMGRGLVELLRETGSPLLTTYFNTAVLADRAECPGVFCVVTDSDIARVWVAADPARTRVRYLVPSRRALRRLIAYGVPEGNIEYTGFPLPGELLGGRDLTALRRNLAARLERIDPAGTFRAHARDEIRQFLGELPGDEPTPPHVTFAVGGAGAQAGVARDLLRSLAPKLADDELRLTLAAGVRTEVAERFESWIREVDLETLRGDEGARMEILLEPTMERYFERFNRRLADTDLLWTKPSELTFFAALGLPLVLTPPVGVQERYNRRWAIEHGAALRQRDPRFAAEWLEEWLQDGALAGAAWNGFLQLPKFGLYHILEAVERWGASTAR